MKPLSKGLIATLALLLSTFSVSPDVYASWLDKVEQYDCRVRVATSTKSFFPVGVEYKNITLLIKYEYNYGSLSYKPILIKFDNVILSSEDSIINYEYYEVYAAHKKEMNILVFNEKTTILQASSDKYLVDRYDGKCEKK